MTAAAILAWVERFPGVMVELTGGEPLFQAGALSLLEQLVATGRQVLLGTNGSLPVDRVPAQVAIILDVKCPDSGMAERQPASQPGLPAGETAARPLSRRDQVRAQLRG